MTKTDHFETQKGHFWAFLAFFKISFSSLQHPSYIVPCVENMASRSLLPFPKSLGRGRFRLPADFFDADPADFELKLDKRSKRSCWPTSSSSEADGFRWLAGGKSGARPWWDRWLDELLFRLKELEGSRKPASRLELLAPSLGRGSFFRLLLLILLDVFERISTLSKQWNMTPVHQKWPHRVGLCKLEIEFLKKAKND